MIALSRSLIADRAFVIFFIDVSHETNLRALPHRTLMRAFCNAILIASGRYSDTMNLQLAFIGSVMANAPTATCSSAPITTAQLDDRAFAELYEVNSRSVFNLVFRSVRDPDLAQDLCQDIWIKVYRELPKLREPAAFRTWLFKIAARACIDAARVRRSRGSTTTLDSDLLASRDPDPEATLLQSERDGRLWATLLMLPERQQLALYLREAEDRTYREIAEILETSESAVETLLFRARRLLSKARQRVEVDGSIPCNYTRIAMAAILDGGGTPVQQHAIRVHIRTCRSCHVELERMKDASRAYAALPFLSVPVVMAGWYGGATSVSNTIPIVTSAGRIVASAVAKFKLLVAAIVVSGASISTIVITVQTPVDFLQLAAHSSTMPSSAKTLQPESRDTFPSSNDIDGLNQDKTSDIELDAIQANDTNASPLGAEPGNEFPVRGRNLRDGESDNHYAISIPIDDTPGPDMSAFRSLQNFSDGTEPESSALVHLADLSTPLWADTRVTAGFSTSIHTDATVGVDVAIPISVTANIHINVLPPISESATESVDALTPPHASVNVDLSAPTALDPNVNANLSGPTALDANIGADILSPIP